MNLAFPFRRSPTNRRTIMDHQHARCSGQALFLAFLTGAAAGAAAGILFAPKAGEHTRRELRTFARKTEEDLIEKAKEARAALDQAIERGKSFVAEKRADVEAAVKAGKEAMKERVGKGCN
jgi:gas vesicle protein